MEPSKEKHTAIEKALNILTLFSPYNLELTPHEISEKLGYHQATTSRTLILLAKKGFLDQNEQTKRFRLGPAIALLNHSLHQSLENEVVRIAKPHIDKLRDSLKETVVLEVLSGRTTVRAYAAEGLRPIRTRGDIGDRLPMYAAAGAKAILAYLDPETWDWFLDRDIPRMTPNTITDIKQIKEQLKAIRRRGTAFDNGEFDVDINAVGAPIFNTQEKPVAAVVVAGLPSRIQNSVDPRIAEEVKATALAISEKLGFKETS